MNGDRQIRVFISSTFRDMQAERDILIKKIFPQLRKLCEERAVTWTEVDLRWGITDEQKAEGKVLPLCLEEIHRCRPYFIGLLGERYGWVPEPTSIPAELLESQPWLKQHIEQSVTELEILHGVFSEEPIHGHAYFYFRDLKYVQSVSLEKRQDFTPESDGAARKLAKLKQKIRGARDEQICELRENFANPEELGEWILEDFTKLIDRLYPRDQMPDPLDQEAARHEAYGRSRRLAFIGREDLFHRLNEHCTAPGKPLVLTGESGCGKSALLAEWVARWRTGHPDDFIVQHYIGSTPDSADWRGLVRRILGQLKRAFAITDDVPVQPDALRNALQEWTRKSADSRRRVILILDALNQLVEEGAAWQLGWLPVAFPTNFSVLVSSLPGESLDALRKRGWPELNVPAFAPAEIVPAALAYFRMFSKTLPPDIMAKLESTPAACNALYLRAVLNELRQFGKHEELKAKAAGYLSAPDPKELYERILERWEHDFGKDLVRQSLSLIWAARRGLSESELVELLGQNGQPLPRAEWTPFYLAAESSLVQRSGLLGFSHIYVSEAVRERFLPTPGEPESAHLRLSEYFRTRKEITPRKVDELPWQLARAGRLEELKDFLTNVEALPALLARAEHDLMVYWIRLEEAGYSRDREFMRLYRFNFARMLQPHVIALIARFLEDSGKYSAAETFLLEAVNLFEAALGAEHETVLALKERHANLLGQLEGDDNAAESAWRDLLQKRERLLGPNDPATLRCVGGLANILAQKGDLESAENLFRRLVESSEHILGPEHPQTVASQVGWARLLFWRGDFVGAERLYRQGVEAFGRDLGAESPETLTCQSGLANVLYCKGDLPAAEASFRRLLEARDRVLGPENPATLTTLMNLSELLHVKGAFVDAEPLYRRLLRSLLKRREATGGDHPWLRGQMKNYVACVIKMGMSPQELGSHLAEIGFRREDLPRVLEPE